MRAPRVGAIVLAAGGASRFGTPKQLLVWKRQTLVARAAIACAEAGCRHVVAVTGAHAVRVEAALRLAQRNAKLSVAHNQDWAAGVQTSIACGLRALLADPRSGLDACVIVLADQPLVDAPFLRKLIGGLAGHDAAGLAYPSGPGVPAAFAARLFARLGALDAEGAGAKALLRDPDVSTLTLDAPACRRDIDTLADWNDFTDNH